MVRLSLPIRDSGEADMSSTSRDWFSWVGLCRAPRVFAIASMAAMLAACAQTSVVGQNPVSLASREAPPETDGKALIAAHRQVAIVKRKEPSSAIERPPADIQKPSDGL